VPQKGNYPEQVDYVYGKLPYVVIMWGPVNEQMNAFINGFVRQGVPVVLGPQGVESVKRFFLGNDDDRSKWWCYSGFTGEKKEIGPVPQHLLIPVETKEEALIIATYLNYFANDFRDMAVTRNEVYLKWYDEFFTGLPEKFDLLIRDESELPYTKKMKIFKKLKELGWDTDAKRGTIRKYKHRDGRMLSRSEYAESYGLRVGEYSTFMDRLVLKPEARGVSLKELKERTLKEGIAKVRK
jgi:CO dehydrogenase/acetyl-CoA synthase alpha subunit